MTTILSSSNASLPKISYLKSIDIFLVTCFIMVFASLLEYACISFLGLVKPATMMMKPGQQQRSRFTRYQRQPVWQSRTDCLLDMHGSPWDSAMHGGFITGETRSTTDNGPSSQHVFVPPVTSLNTHTHTPFHMAINKFKQYDMVLCDSIVYER